MSTYNVPGDFPTIQDAVNSASVGSGDTIYVEAGYDVVQNIVIEKDNIALVCKPSTVTINGKEIGGTGIQIQANGVKIIGFRFSNYLLGICVMGNYNQIINVFSVNSVRNGISIIGDYNTVRDCKVNNTGTSAIITSGNQNIFIDNYIDNCNRCIIGSFTPITNNIFAYNTMRNNLLGGISIYSLGSTDNIFYRNFMSGGAYGIQIGHGRCAIIENMINDCEDAICLATDQNIISKNTLVECQLGMNLTTNRTLISENTLQTGKYTGIIANGDDNRILKNVIYNYSNIGILANGYNNKIRNNNIQETKTDIIINPEAKCQTHQHATASEFMANHFTVDESISKMFDIFK